MVTVTFDGPELSESGSANPFLDHRLDVVFENGSHSVTVPGYFAADGNAADTGADAGRKWRVHFVPDQVGRWDFQARFTTGSGVAVHGGGRATAFNGARGHFEVRETHRSDDHPRGRGMLRYVGERYLRFAGSGEPFLEAGPNSPENLLAYYEFDGTSDHGGIVSNFLHEFRPHATDFVGGPTWKGGKGKNLLGAVSYVAQNQLNSLYVITLTAHGDGDDVWPFREFDAHRRYDCSKLDQWNRVFRHATDNGIHLQLVLTETENESYFEVRDGASFFADSRKLYYREMVARFGHHLALTWNLGEENGWDDWSRTNFKRPNTDAQRRAFAKHLKDLDPYQRSIVVHTYHGPKAGEDQDGVYGPLTDKNNPCDAITGASMQGPFSPEQSVRAPSDDPSRNNHAKVRYWIERSAAAGRPWVVGHHEQLPASHGTRTDNDPADPEHDVARCDVLWGTLMAGGASVQYYFGYAYRSSSGDDLTCESFHTRDDLWGQTALALDFFRKELPFDSMHCRSEFVDDEYAYCLTDERDTYAVFLREAKATTLDVGPLSSVYSIQWFDPRRGGALQDGSVTRAEGPGLINLGRPPHSGHRDWVVLVRRLEQLPNTGCAGAGFPSVSGPLRLGEEVEFALPDPGPDVVPMMVFGVRTSNPIRYDEPTICAPHGSCTLDLLPVYVTSNRRFYKDVVPNDSALLGTAMRLQGAFVNRYPVCLTFTGVLDVPFER